MTDERFLVTGALGCIGAWTCGVLAEEGASVVILDQFYRLLLWKRHDTVAAMAATPAPAAAGVLVQ